MTINSMDAYTQWGISMDSNALSALMTPAAMKERVSNESRLEHGRRVLNIAPRLMQRDLTLTFNLVAESEAQFFARYISFCEELKKGELNIKTSFQPDVTYKCLYVSCTQFSEFMRGIGSFVLKLIEPNPEDRQ